ncbi:MAG: adenylyltransferase/cytidyltransferase family protein [Actinobacteria bacterium]|nr:adenylyltransferase/cytidyltransferase family protein [Actinomycetota bacterium]
MHPTGLIVGRFDPPHLGHSYMIEWARERCERVVVFVNTRDGETFPGDRRAEWLRDLHPGATVVRVAHELGNDWDDEDLWAAWIALFRSKWPFETGPHVVVSSDFYISELARRLGAEPLVCDPERVNVPISATAIRNDPATHLSKVAPVVREWIEANYQPG